MKRTFLLTCCSILLMTLSPQGFANANCVGHSCNNSESEAGPNSNSKSYATSGSLSGASSYSSGGTSNSSSGGNTQKVTVTDSGQMHYSGSFEVKNVPNPPDIIANPTAPCRIAVGASGSGVGFGIGIGTSVLDDGCDAREDSRLLYNMGLHDLAKMRLCAKPEMAAVIPECQKKAEAAATAPANSQAQYSGSTNPLVR